MDYNEKLKELRKARGISQYKLAKLSGLTQSAISQYESGKYNVGIDALERVCPVLGVSVVEFMQEGYADPLLKGSKPYAISADGVRYDIAPSEKLKELYAKIADLDDDQQHAVNALVDALKKLK